MIGAWRAHKIGVLTIAVLVYWTQHTCSMAIAYWQRLNAVAVSIVLAIVWIVLERIAGRLLCVQR